VTRTVAPNTPTIATDIGTGIRQDEILPLATAMRRLKAGRHWWRAARKAGCPIRRQGGRSFVIGSEFVAWLAKVGTVEGAAE
jgi:hypothetical protein